MPLQEDLRLATYADLKFLVVSEAQKLMNLKVKRVESVEIISPVFFNS